MMPSELAVPVPVDGALALTLVAAALFRSDLP
jgi:hypothetical protein